MARLKARSKKSVSIRFVSMVIESPYLNNALILSSFGPFALLIVARYIYIYIYYIYYIYIYIYYIYYIYVLYIYK